PPRRCVVPPASGPRRRGSTSCSPTSSVSGAVVATSGTPSANGGGRSPSQDDGGSAPRWAGLTTNAKGAHNAFARGPRGYPSAATDPPAGTRSANQNPSRSTTARRPTATGRPNTGPPYTNGWNSPRSPHGSLVAGRSATHTSSDARQQNGGASCLGSTHTTTARNPASMNA